MKNKLLDFILKTMESGGNQPSNIDLTVFYDKIENDNLTLDDKKILIEDFLSNHLNFDEQGEPTKQTLVIEDMIDYLLDGVYR